MDKLREKIRGILEDISEHHLYYYSETDPVIDKIIARFEEELKELRDELRVGNILTAKLTDQCREFEAQLIISRSLHD